MSAFVNFSGSVYKSFLQAATYRLLHEVIQRSTNGKDSSGGKIFVLDEVTVKVMSSFCQMSDMMNQGISLVEDLYKRRQPFPSFDAVYFIHPKRETAQMLKADLCGETPLYRKAHVLFSSQASMDVLQSIKTDASLMSRVVTLQEVNFEYIAIDSQGFSTDQPRALQHLFGEQRRDQGSNTDLYESCINTIAHRLGSVFTSLKEFPAIRYSRAKSAIHVNNATTHGELVPTKLAAALWEQLQAFKSSVSGFSDVETCSFPDVETCELLILDRSADLVAPVIHEWTYEAMCYDLLDMDYNKYVYEVTNTHDRVERKEALLDERDPLWVELRHLHFGDVCKRVHEKKNTLMELEESIKSIKNTLKVSKSKLNTSLQQHKDLKPKLSLHANIATELDAKIEKGCLKQVGMLEQELVFGNAASKELIGLLTARQELSKEDKLRLLIIYSTTHPEILDPTKQLRWMELAGLNEGDMQPQMNMEYMGVDATKKESFSIGGTRRSCHPDESEHDLFQFHPVIQDLIEDLAKGELSKEEYPYVNEPSQAMNIVSKRTNTGASKSRSSSDGKYSSESTLRYNQSGQAKIVGKRIFVFIVGGATRSELRACHKLTSQLRRDVVLGSTSLDSPHQFLKKLKVLNDWDEIALEKEDNDPITLDSVSDIALDNDFEISNKKIKGKKNLSRYVNKTVGKF